MSPADNVKLVGGMGANEAASAIGAMDDGRKREVLSAMGDKELLGLTDGLGAAYEDDKRLPAAERQQMREAAAERAKSLAPALASVPTRQARGFAQERGRLAGRRYPERAGPRGQGGG
jgi:hypothetical protein